MLVKNHQNYHDDHKIKINNLQLSDEYFKEKFLNNFSENSLTTHAEITKRGLETLIEQNLTKKDTKYNQSSFKFNKIYK